MTEESSTTSHLSVAMTTKEIDDTQTAGATSKTSSSSNDLGFYFQLAVILIGIVGTVGNALVLYALVASKQHKKHMLIVNQNALDLFSCFFLIISYGLKLRNIYLTGTTGYWLCMTFLDYNLMFWGITGSIVNLAAITIDRYLKVVHHVWSKKWVTARVIYSAMAFAWFAGIVYNSTLSFATSGVVDGVCYALVFLKSNVDRLATLIYHMVSFYFLIIAIFIFCYWRILAAVRRQASVMAGHRGPGSSTSRAQSNQMQINVIKTVILVSALYAITWMPKVVFYVAFLIDQNVKFLSGTFYATVFLTLVYVCANPFIYATRFYPVRKILIDMIPCKKTPVISTDAPGARPSALNALAMQERN